ncbi:hypothetical protein BCR44DRAFT_1527941 [Catenaria anguillulae PL171]|uniref:Cilia- and flagella-associated protein 418 n=1 Tax=Catenaria anguillulae PL171 TaxID=765915 RepID=A0A1Y2I2I9_9FUNG|nr:hypothetical protein BCR44DRAFT_1527941 [Catenaria anguillulae PL171]
MNDVDDLLDSVEALLRAPIAPSATVLSSDKQRLNGSGTSGTKAGSALAADLVPPDLQARRLDSARAQQLSASHATHASASSLQPTQSTRSNGDPNDLDNLLADLNATTRQSPFPSITLSTAHLANSRPLSRPTLLTPTTSSSTFTPPSSSQQLLVKCPPGAARLATCTRLRCTGCDFVVEQFPGKQWKYTNGDKASAGGDVVGDDTANAYLFFRNHMPNRQALAEGLVAAKGTG